jgi:hypothetical protein
MMTRCVAVLAGVALASVVLAASPASALTMQECSAKYKQAQKDNTLKGMKWNDFRKAECGSDDTAPTPAAAKPTTAAAKPAATTAAAKPGSAVYPNAVSSKYSKESAGKARMHTCLDQYNANKASNGNGGMNWIAKGGGYYSECNKRLKS